MPVAILLLFVPALALDAGADYQSEVEHWRAQREADLKGPDGWLALAGLFWLKEGANTVGAGPENDIALPPNSTPVHAGVLQFHAGKTEFHAAPGLDASINGGSRRDGLLRSDSAQPDLLRIGRLTLLVIHRGSRYGIRLRDQESDARLHFSGLRWYPVRESYRVTADFHPYSPPKILLVPNVLGDTSRDPSPGYAEFVLLGQRLRLEPTVEEGRLFFVFRDRTAGRTTYGAGRFLKSDMPSGGKVTLDFNEAYNPPCAFTPYATCPLPTPDNRLPIAIEAGELNYGNH